MRTNPFAPKKEDNRLLYWLINSLSLIALLILSQLLTGCMTYDKALAKYGKQVIDTTTVSVPVVVTIPRDSAVIRTRTDTSRVIIEQRNKTSWVRLYRDKDETRVEGGCDSATIAKNVLAKVPQPKAIWGVDKKYKEQAEQRMTIIYCLAGLIIIGAIAYTFIHQLKLSIAKR